MGNLNMFVLECSREYGNSLKTFGMKNLKKIKLKGILNNILQQPVIIVLQIANIFATIFLKIKKFKKKCFIHNQHKSQK